MRYFFHIYNDGNRLSDEEGTECDGPKAARHEAIESAKDLARQAIGNGTPTDVICVEIEDNNGERVAALRVEEVITHPDTPEFRKVCSTDAGPNARRIRRVHSL